MIVETSRPVAVGYQVSDLPLGIHIGLLHDIGVNVLNSR